MHTNEITTLLATSDPVGELTGEERRLTAAMIKDSAPARNARRIGKPVAIGALAAIILGGGGAIAVAAGGAWEGWAENDALATVHYQLPSGVACEVRVGNIEGAPAEVDDVIRESLAGVELDDRDAAAGLAYVGVAGDPATDDHAYETGIWWAVQLRVQSALETHGLEESWGSLEGQAICQ